MPLFDLLLEHVPPPTHDPEHPLQAQVTNLDASPYLGRIAICRVRHGVIRKGQRIGWCRSDGTVQARDARASCSSRRRSSACPSTRPAPARSSPSAGSTT